MSKAQGRLIAGRYRLIERIGSGAMGVVWRAEDEVLDRTVAVKELLIQAGHNREETDRARQRALREGRIAARLQHPHAIAVFDVADDGGRPVLIMEYLPSRSLADVLAKRGRLPREEVARIGIQVSAALVAAHAAGIVHRDIKPGNILIGPDGTVKLTDFGISRAAGDVTVTATGMFAGTPAYLSPEVARGHEPGPASDVFSLGSTLYAAVEGTPPFGTNDNAIALLHAVSTGQVAPPKKAGALTVPLMRMLADDPAARPTMKAVHEELSSLDAQPIRTASAVAAPTLVATRSELPAATRRGLPFGTRTDLSADRQEERRSRRPWVYGALALLLLAGVIALIASLGGPDGGTPSAAETSPSSAAPATTTLAAAPDFAGAVGRYYGLMPGGTDEGWELLGPGLRAQGKESYERFWKSIKAVTVISAPQAQGTTVTVGVEFVVDGGDVYREVHRLGMVVRDGAALIDTDSLVSSSRVSGEQKTGDDDKKDESKGKKDDD